MGNGRIRKAIALVAAGALAHGTVGRLHAGDGPAGIAVSPAGHLSSSDYLATAEFAAAEGLLDEVELYLAVTLNGRDTGLVAEFALHRDGRRMSSARSELEAIGIAPPPGQGRRVFLDRIPGLTYAYDEPRQAIAIAVPSAALRPREIAGPRRPDHPQPQPGWGAVFNYRLTANLGNDVLADGFRLKGAHADLEARLYSPLGVLVTTGAVSAAGAGFGDARFTRHDTYYTLSSAARMLTFTAGDFITSTQPWGRPVRLGGVQLRREFDLRGDIVTTPRLSYTGMAAVPSAVDVYVGNVRAWSGKAEAGPFTMSDLPHVTSSGEAVIVIRDEAGNEQVSRVPFFAGQDVLKRGMLDFSLDAGRPRGNYGLGGPDYLDETVASGSLRYGVTDRLTLLAHAEYGPELRALSLGATAILFDAAEATLAHGRSRFRGVEGSMTYGTLRTRIGGLEVRLSSQRRSAGFSDLAHAIGVLQAGAGASAEDLARLRPARALDTVTLNFNDWIDAGSLGLSYIRAERPGQTDSILSAAYSRRLWDDGPSLRLAGFADTDSGDAGFSLGLSMTLGNNTYAGAGVSRGRSGRLASHASLTRPVGREVGSHGYRLNVNGGGRLGSADLAGAYRTGFGLAELRLRSGREGRVAASASFEGAIVAAGGTVLAGNHIRDGFAVVNVGVPGVPVELNGREVVRTGRSGAALVPDLRPYRNNRVAIDPANLPPDASLAATAMTVVPARKSGVTVQFGSGRSNAALLTVFGPDGAVLPAGTPVRLSGSREDHVVGYDGELWLERLKKTNTLTATLDRGTCTARFDFAPVAGEMTEIRGVMCR